MPEMTTAERNLFMGEGRKTAALATVRKDGRPHVAPVWFVMDGDDVVFMTGRDTVKGHAIRREGRVALAVDDPNPPFAFATVEGTVEHRDCADIPEESLQWSTRIAARYVGEERAEEFGRRNAVPGELLVRVKVTNAASNNDMLA
ncbi:PPOX class probable F420-dependent enzyme [Rubrobacter radiotolerans]|uniref:PPOX class F420-dependent oxidoreductase n=2 Tax=Rubrobacter radiotolerans TaxID=42256 RepID=A0A023X065_RUBRA|nr:PPOX class F420-dependent oxidoreductase [Rubrobacter radiotolerans]AHY45877.1 PPOX class probable F420-dependent enzyme [Rubrobacter radiotolerans]MDX5893290.1 PPOX class F420-dependent oxidoreductase [Rubrobacter radiotolerans]SMC03436.1 PPOX class probable F420-dependent enzyme [Rubrobacter radiotolerans DSM 5868]